MSLPYAELMIKRKYPGWKILECGEEFLSLTGFTKEELQRTFQHDFLQMLSVADISAADTFFASAGDEGRVCPWIFTLDCRGKTCTVLIQKTRIKPDGSIGIRLHDAAFCGEQTDKMSMHLQSLKKSIPSGLCCVLFDECFTIIWYNDYYLNMLGYTEEQFREELRCRGSGYVHPEDSSRIRKMLQDALQCGQRVITTEIRVIKRGGDICTLLASLSFTEEEIDGIPVLYSTCIDVTIKNREQKIKIEEERFKIAMEQASSYILEYDVRQQCLTEFDRLKKYFGLQGTVMNIPESLIDTGVIEKESLEVIRRIFRQIDDGERYAEGILCLRGLSRSTERYWIRMRLTAIQDHTGCPVKAILLVEDITEHYKMELRYKEEENRRQAMTYKMDFSVQFQVTTDKILSVNQSKFPFFDFDSSDSYSELFRRNAALKVHPEDRAEYLRRLNADYLAEKFKKGIPELKFDFRVVEEDGEVRWMQALMHIIREPVSGEICAYTYTKDIAKEKKTELELRRHAEQDSLTGLYNRYTIERLANRELGRQRRDGIAALYMLDLDNFKILNDTYGHVQGDQMLCKTAECLRDIFPKEAMIGRIGGDEMVVFLYHCTSKEQASWYAQTVCSKISRQSAAAGVVTVSVGIAYAPEHGGTFAELYHCADHALYRAKSAGKAGFAVYESNITEEGDSEEKLLVSRDWLLEESNDIVYVSDFYSYDLLYMNRGARKLFGVSDQEYVGKKCYAVLQKKDKPCEFCTNYRISRESFYCWEFRNTSIGRTFLLRDRIVDWYGVPARIELATDVSTIDQRNQHLEEQLKIDQLIIACVRILNSAQSLEAAAGLVLSQLKEFYGAQRAFIMNYVADQDVLQCCFECTNEGLQTMRQIVGDKGIRPDDRMKHCFETHDNYNIDCNHGDETDCQRCVPFYIGGKPAGIIGLHNPTVLADDLTALETLSYFISEEFSRKKLSDSLTFLSYHDSLTGLWNRNWYVEYLKGFPPCSLRTLGVAVADLNALKEINKLRGHRQGDEVVKRGAELLRKSFPGAQIFRLSGDEFVVHSENYKKHEFLEQVRQVKANAHLLAANGISVGYAWTDQDMDCSKLTMQATDIMLMEKQEYYQNERKKKQPGDYNYARLKELLECIENGNFKMYLQPKADCKNFRLNGAEALVRFKSPEYGVIAPGNFIPLLEEEHMIKYVDLFMFEEVCRLLARWKKEGRELLIVSVNFSRQTVLEPNLVNTLIHICEKYTVPKGFIEVEVTETLGDYESVTISEISSSIKAAGFRLALDDFGSHYTNMSMLSSVSADVLKVDSGLMQNVMSGKAKQLVLKSVLCLCRELGISSIAEGVETKEQLDLLRSLSCDSIQGFLFGRPVAVQEFEDRYFHEGEAPAIL